jgi:hypothetical protein
MLQSNLAQVLVRGSLKNGLEYPTEMEGAYTTMAGKFLE